jgi:tellurite resistance protein TerC
MVEKFSYLKVGLSAVLVFVGAKMTLVDVVKVPALVSLAVIASLIGGSVVASLLKARSLPGSKERTPDPAIPDAP